MRSHLLEVLGILQMRGFVLFGLLGVDTPALHSVEQTFELNQIISQICLIQVCIFLINFKNWLIRLIFQLHSQSQILLVVHILGNSGTFTGRFQGW